MKPSPMRRNTALRRSPWKHTGNPARTKNSPSPAVRQAVRDRDGGCQAALLPGVRHISCGGILEVHHLWRKSQGGPNTAENLKLLCSVHHEYVHRHVAWAKRVGLLRVPGDLDGSVTRAVSGMMGS